MSILAIDPGNTESAYVLIDGYVPTGFGKLPNRELLGMLYRQVISADDTAIEMIEARGMSVDAATFDTCVWIGRFYEAISYKGAEPDLVKRRLVKLHHCGTSTAKDGNIAQALKDRFAYGVRNHGKGTKKQPGWFYGFRADVWQAYALAVYTADRLDAEALDRLAVVS